MTFISFSCIVALIRTLEKLNISDDSGDAYLIPDLRGKESHLFPLSILAVGFFFFLFNITPYPYKGKQEPKTEKEMYIYIVPNPQNSPIM